MLLDENFIRGGHNMESIRRLLEYLHGVQGPAVDGDGVETLAHRLDVPDRREAVQLPKLRLEHGGRGKDALPFLPAGFLLITEPEIRSYSQLAAQTLLLRLR